MTTRTARLDGVYKVASLTATRIGLVSPDVVNAQWLVGDLDGAGTTTIAANISMRPASSGEPVTLDGQYTVSAVTPTQLTLATPTTVAADWAKLTTYQQGRTQPLNAYISKAETASLGPFIVENPNTELLVVNVIALAGLYTDDGKHVRGINVAFEVKATPVDQTDTPIGPTQTFVSMVENLDAPGAKTDKSMKAKTLVCSLTNPGRQSVVIRRTTNNNYSFDGQVVDEIKCQDLYGMGPVDQPDFGNVTTIRTRTFATQGALNLKERKLNCLVTRRVPVWTGGTTFSAPTATNNAADILVEVCRDPLLGNRALSEIDLDSIHGAVTAAGDYFGDTAATEFCYTFDDDNTSFEEMATAIAGAVFSTPYRQGVQIKLNFERPTEDSVLLFNHRNKVPGSESRTSRFGPSTDNDGVEFEYVDPDSDTPSTIYIPADRSARKPRKVRGYGVRNFRQAYWLAWRAYNKLTRQISTVSFNTLSEAAPLVRGDRILVADGTRADTQDGEVEAQDGLVLTLSQDVDMSGPAGYTIFLQLPDATVDAIPITAGALTNQVVLSRAPRVGLALDPDLYARASYDIVAGPATDPPPRSNAFLVTDKGAQDGGRYSIEAVNYSSLYYQNDTLRLWLTFAETAGFYDHSAYQNDGVAVGAVTTVVDTIRGRSYSNDGTAGRYLTFPTLTPPESYTKAVWLQVSDFSADRSILNSDVEFFLISGGNLLASHGGAPAIAPWPAGANWHHAAIAYDSTEATFALYIDGELVDELAAVGDRALHGLVGFQNFKGRASDLRLINRALSSDEVRELYRATRK